MNPFSYLSRWQAARRSVLRMRLYVEFRDHMMNQLSGRRAGKMAAWLALEAKVTG